LSAISEFGNEVPLAVLADVGIDGGGADVGVSQEITDIG